jgi:lipoate-protein ligase A
MKRELEKMLRWIDDVPRNAAMNMALDEILFNEYKNNPVLRTYYWDNAYTTIGYFQKVKDMDGVGLVRRFTGGLMVNHHNDISYSVIISSDFFNVYNQQKIYRNIHLAIQKALQALGINSIILDKKTGNTSSICVQTFCENDLILNGKKIAGSCLRRRGSKLIVQGSIHINLNAAEKKVFSLNFVRNTAEFLKIETKISSFNNNDIEQAQKIAKEKYSNLRWNNKI